MRLQYQRVLPYISPVLRRTWPHRRAAVPAAPVPELTDAGPGPEWDPEPFEDSPPGGSRRFLTRRRVALMALAVVAVGLVVAYTQKDHYTDNAAELTRSLIGDENTARLEAWYFRIQDRIDRTKYSIFGGESDPFGSGGVLVSVIPAVERPPIVYYPIVDGAAALNSEQLRAQLAALNFATPKPMTLPEVRLLLDEPAEGEGVWTTAGLPRSSPSDILMAKTYVRPDSARPYASVAVLLIDARRVRLHFTGGTKDPGGDRGVPGPGRIPDEAYSRLLAAWNGGFQGAHGAFGAYGDGQTYRPLRDGYASLVVMKDGTLKMGAWGDDVTWSDDIESVRQNAILLVKDGEISSRVGEGNNTWGYVKVDSTEFITWRSAVGLTKDGDLLVAAGNSLSAESLAKALWAAGAHTAMQLDINNPYVLTSLFFPQPDGSLHAERFVEAMPDSPGRFLKTQERDFFWVTLDESRYR
jgi:hypothetical protein